MKLKNIISVGIFFMCLVACKEVSALFKDGDVVARVGKHKLYSSEVETYIPKGISPEDSTKLALQYINSWASELLFLDVAMSELSKNERNVNDELEVYRRSLLKFRYEHKYVNQRLDTLITEKEIEEYYEAHKDNFRLTAPILKARFITLSGETPSIQAIKKVMSSDSGIPLAVTDSLAFSSALRYTDYGGEWIDAITLARDFGRDFNTVLNSKVGNFVEISDTTGVLSVAYIPSIMQKGEYGPIDYHRQRIKDIILSSRKQILLNSLEQDLLDKARSKENFEIY